MTDTSKTAKNTKSITSSSSSSWRMVELQQVEDSWPVVVVDMPAVLSA